MIGSWRPGTKVIHYPENQHRTGPSAITNTLKSRTAAGGITSSRATPSHRQTSAAVSYADCCPNYRDDTLANYDVI